MRRRDGELSLAHLSPLPIALSHDSEVNSQVSTQTLSPEVTIPNFPSNLDRPKQPSPTKRPTLRILPPDVTYTGSPIQPLQKGLPKQTESLCPECNRVIRADIFADDGKVVMEKSCAQHGRFRDILYSHCKSDIKMEEWNVCANLALANPQIEGGKSCPVYCGLCNKRPSHTAI